MALSFRTDRHPGGVSSMLARRWADFFQSGSWSRNAAINRDPANWTAASGLQIAPVWSAVTRMSSGLGGADMAVVDEDGDVIEDGLPVWASPHLRPNQDQSCVDMMRMIGMSLLVGGNAYLQVLGRTRDGLPDSVVSLPPAEIALEYARGSRAVSKPMPSYRIYHAGIAHVPYSSANREGTVLHLRLYTLADRWLGISPLEQVAPPLRTALAAEATAELYFASGGIPPGFLSYKGSKVGEDQLDELIEHYKDLRRRPELAHVPLPLEGDVSWISTFIAPEQAQLLDSRKFAWNAAAAAYNMHPLLLGAPGHVTLSGMREIQRDYREFTLSPFLGLVSKLLGEMLPFGEFLRLSPARARLEPLERAREWERLVNMGAMLPSEVRQERGLPPIAGIDDRPRPQNRGGDGGDSDSSMDDGTNLDGGDQGEASWTVF